MKLTELQKAPLADYAATLPRDYPERYLSLLRKAFADYRGVLNAAQLRELAGGGSPNTAQKVISEFLEEIQRLLAYRLPDPTPTPEHRALGVPGLPETLQAAMSQLTLDAWRLAWLEFEKRAQDVQAEAQTAIGNAKAEAQTLIDAARLATDQEREAREAAEADAGRCRTTIDELREREQRLDADLRSAQAAQHEMQTTLTRATEQMEDHHRHLVQANTSLERMSREHAQSLVAAQRDHQTKLDTERQAARQQIEVLTRERDRALTDSERARDRTATAEIERARSEQAQKAATAELEGLRLVAAELRDQLAARAKEAATAEAQAAELRSQMSVAERDVQRLAEWIDSGKGSHPIDLSNPAALILAPMKRRLAKPSQNRPRRKAKRESS